MNKPNLYVVAAPSGGGKTSLIRALLEKDAKISLSISHTTRAPRPGEVEGLHYYFVDDPTFTRMIAENAFLEHAQVFDKRYGTGRDAVRLKLAAGYDVILDIDWQGARQIRGNFPDCCTIFILPPSLEVLRNRLANRGQDSLEVIERRMKDARAEISHWSEFDFVIINDDFDETLADLQSIVRHRKPCRPQQKDRNDDLVAELLKYG
ncbi:guanylate kinase [Pseudomonadota bacterium]